MHKFEPRIDEICLIDKITRRQLFYIKEIIPIKHNYLENRTLQIDLTNYVSHYSDDASYQRTLKKIDLAQSTIQISEKC